MEYEPKAGSSLSETAIRIVRLANEKQEQVNCIFNDIKMTANPNDNPSSVVKKWREESHRRYEEWSKTPEGQLSITESGKRVETTIADLEDFAKKSQDPALAAFVGDAAAWIKKQHKKGE